MEKMHRARYTLEYKLEALRLIGAGRPKDIGLVPSWHETARREDANICANLLPH